MLAEVHDRIEAGLSMPKLTTVDLRTIDALFGMYSGHVMDFSNKRFDAFFKRDVGVDIYDDAYGIYGDSKGKRLQAFLDVAQTPAIIKALEALWEYRQAGGVAPTEREKVPDAGQRLSAIIQKIGGGPIASERRQDSEGTPTSKPRPAETALSALESEFARLHAMNDAAQARGYAFESFLRSWFDSWGLDARGSFKLVGEQIDGSFVHSGAVYLLEARWRERQADAAALRAFQEKVGDRFEGSRGLFISISGFTEEALEAFVQKRVLLMDGMDIQDALYRRLPLEKIVTFKMRVAIEERRPFVHVRELFR
jgi:hypothetical protein